MTITRDRKDADRLECFKKNVQEGYDYFKDNYERFNRFRRFVFKQSLSDNEKTVMNSQGKPNLEFNVIEPFISRQLGEFSKQEPGVTVSAYDGQNVNPDLIDFVEQHFRHFLSDANMKNVQYEVYKDILSGGFGVFKLGTKYRNNKTWDQDIFVERIFPIFVGFDPLAKESHKGDGRFCFEFRVLSEEEFKIEFPGKNIENLKFNRSFKTFNWSYKVGMIRMIVLCEYYEKRNKKDVLLKISTGESVTESQYQKILDNWEDLAPPPVIVSKRNINRESIWRYVMYEGGFIEKKKTNFPIFPLIFADNNSVILMSPDNSNVEQFTRPYAYHAEGAQRLKNYAGNSLANEVENVMASQFMIAREALPKEEDFRDALTNVQRASVVVYNSLYEEDPDKPIPNPIQVIQRQAAPPQIMQAFDVTNSVIQMEFGSYDASLGINDNNLSGNAIRQGAGQSNMASTPGLNGYMAGFQRVADGYVKMMPTYYSTARMMPIKDAEGISSHIKINQPGGLDIDFDAEDLNIKIEAGVNFRVQQADAFNQLTSLMQVMPKFAEFMNEEGIPVLLDNLEIRGIDRLKGMASQWMQQQQQQKQQMLQMQQQEMQNNPAVMKNKIEMAKVQQSGQKMQQEAQKSQTQFQIDMATLQTDQNKVIADLEQSQAQNQVQMLKAQTEQFSKTVQLEIAKQKHELTRQDQSHRHAKEAIEMHHGIKHQERTHELKEKEFSEKQKESENEREEPSDME